MTRDLGEVRERLASGERLVAVTVAGVRGSAPREVGARMWVSATSTFGSIGGGQLEYACTRTAVEQLASSSAPAPSLRRFTLGANCGQCCGGVVDVLFEVVSAETRWLAALWEGMSGSDRMLLITQAHGSSFKRWAVGESSRPVADAAVDAAVEKVLRDGLARREGRAPSDLLLVEPFFSAAKHVAVFGAGHVGSALVHVLQTLDLKLRWIDGRQGLFPRGLPATVQAIESDAPEREALAFPEGSYYLVMTHDHALDYQICRAVLARGDAAYLGLIGSITKRRRFLKRLAAEGLNGDDALVCPIGIRGISGKAPAEIAVAVAAELLTRMAAAGSAHSLATVSPLHRIAR